jgi:broad specificity phosphatase PhoE
MAGVKSGLRSAQPQLSHPRNIIIVRHGETPANKAGRTGRVCDTEQDVKLLRGKSDRDLPLTPRGREQARCIGRLIRKRWQFAQFDFYYDSGYRRSIETLKLILESYPKSERRRSKRRSHLDLRERDAGYLYGMTLNESRLAFPWWEKHEKRVGPVYSRPPGGESLADAWQRVHMFLNSLRRARPGKDVLIVAHGRLMLGFKYWLEKRPAMNVDRLYREHHHIHNCEAWWYERSTRDTKYLQCRRLVPRMRRSARKATKPVPR